VSETSCSSSMGVVVSAAEGTSFSLGFLPASGGVEKAKNDRRERERERERILLRANSVTYILASLRPKSKKDKIKIMK